MTKEQYYINKFRDEIVRHNRARKKIRIIELCILFGWVFFYSIIVGIAVFH